MTTVIDTNVLIGFWDLDPQQNISIQLALDECLSTGGLVIPAPVYAELRAGPGRTESFLDKFLDDTLIEVDWHIPQAAWKLAGSVFALHAARRRKNKLPGPRRILADFVIGAYALQHGFKLLTLDTGLYRASFPKLKLLTPTL
jgi:predicted nucleic acid-binding protein